MLSAVTGVRCAAADTLVAHRTRLARTARLRAVLTAVAEPEHVNATRSGLAAGVATLVGLATVARVLVWAERVRAERGGR